MCGLRVPRDASNEVRLCEGPLAALEYRKYIPHSRSRWSVTTLRQRSVPICQRGQSFMGVSAPLHPSTHPTIPTPPSFPEPPDPSFVVQVIFIT